MRTIERSVLQGTITPPPSKSITHRAYILAAFSEQDSEISNLLISADTNATRDAMERMGAVFEELPNNTLRVEYPVDKGGSILNCRNSGTTLRLVTAMSAIFTEETTLFGDDSLNTRPMLPLIKSLQELGSDIESIDGHAPITIKSPIRNFYTTCSIKGNLSSQYISALLFMAAVRGEDIVTEVRVEPPIVSRPYLRLSEQLLEFVGIDITKSGNTYTVIGKSNINRFSLNVPSDYSSAAFFIGAAALPGNDIKLEQIDNNFQQADAAIIDIVEDAGARVTVESNTVHIKGGELTSFDANISDAPDLFPILSVLAAFAKGKSTIHGAPHLKFKETNRIKAMADVLQANGIDFDARDDGAIITGGQPQGGVTVDSHHDHRIAMAAAILGTRTVKPLKLENADAVNVSYPGFFSDLTKLHT